MLIGKLLRVDRKNCSDKIIFLLSMKDILQFEVEK